MEYEAGNDGNSSSLALQSNLQSDFFFFCLSLPLYIMKISISGRHSYRARSVSCMQHLLTLVVGFGEGSP